MINIIDLFSGAGGLTEGFRNQQYKILGHVEKEKAACETLKLREAYYYLKEKNKLELYNDFLNSKTSMEDLLEHVPQEKLKKILNFEISKENIHSIFSFFDDLEEKLANPQTSLLLLCNPHNPVGKIWDREELKRIGELCWKHHVLVLSDEIHCDITEPGKDYSPFASVSETCKNNSITCVAATKAFNIAGIQTAAVIVPDKTIRHRVSRGLNTDEVAEPNVFALTAPIAAFTKGGAWLDELRAYLWENRKTAEAFIKEEIPQISVVAAEATYLLWIDCTRIAKKEDNLCAFIRSHSGLYLCDGAEYRNGDGFLRMNLACPKTQVEDGLRRLKESVEAYQKRYAG